MDSVTFRSTYDGDVIRVPEKFKDLIQRDVEVTVNNVGNGKTKRQLKFEALSVDTRDFVFNRDEANDR